MIYGNIYGKLVIFIFLIEGNIVMNLTQKEIETACKLVYNTTYIPIFFIKKDQEIARTFNNIYSSLVDRKKVTKTLKNFCSAITSF
jgi:hypothetical protein